MEKNIYKRFRDYSQFLRWKMETIKPKQNQNEKLLRRRRVSAYLASILRNIIEQLILGKDVILLFLGNPIGPTRLVESQL